MGIPKAPKKTRAHCAHLFAISLALASCGPASYAPTVNAANAPLAASSSAEAVELVESAPIETDLDHADVPNAADVWLAMIESAERSLDIAEFYAVSAPGSRLEPVVRAIEAAADRGVTVRFLIETIFLKTYPELVARLGARKGITVRHFDASKTMGGILHAKYFVVDDRESYLGSQNFDWRSLEHIQELGVRIREPRVTHALAEVFASDWAFAGAEVRPIRLNALDFPVTTSRDGASAMPALSPKGFVGDDALWDLPALVHLLDGAKRSVEVQLLTYHPAHRDHAPFRELDDALRRAASRGVVVRLLCSHWQDKPGLIDAVRDLARLPNVEVRLLHIPPWSGGEVAFGRVAHAKYLVIDEGEVAWIGTSNWEGDYFTKSRNVGLVLRGGAVGPRLHRIFDDGWAEPFAERVGQLR